MVFYGCQCQETFQIPSNHSRSVQRPSPDWYLCEGTDFSEKIQFCHVLYYLWLPLYVIVIIFNLINVVLLHSDFGLVTGEGEQGIAGVHSGSFCYWHQDVLTNNAIHWLIVWLCLAHFDSARCVVQHCATLCNIVQHCATLCNKWLGKWLVLNLVLESWERRSLEIFAVSAWQTDFKRLPWLR